MAVTPDGRIISVSGDATIKIWDGNNYSLIKSIDKSDGGHENFIRALALTTDGRIISGSDD